MSSEDHAFRRGAQHAVEMVLNALESGIPLATVAKWAGGPLVRWRNLSSGCYDGF